MKIVTLLLGLLTFSIVATIMFSAVQDYLIQNEFGGASEWETLSVNYGEFTGEVSTDSDSTLRQIENLTKSGEFASESQQISLLEGAVSSGKLGTNFITNFEDVINKIGSDTNKYIDTRLITVAIGIITIIIVLSFLFFLRGFKAET